MMNNNNPGINIPTGYGSSPMAQFVPPQLGPQSPMYHGQPQQAGYMYPYGNVPAPSAFYGQVQTPYYQQYQAASVPYQPMQNSSMPSSGYSPVPPPLPPPASNNNYNSNRGQSGYQSGAKPSGTQPARNAPFIGPQAPVPFNKPAIQQPANVPSPTTGANNNKVDGKFNFNQQSHKIRLTDKNRKEGWHLYLSDEERKMVEKILVEAEEFDGQFKNFEREFEKMSSATSTLGNDSLKTYNTMWIQWKDNLLSRREQMIQLQEIKLQKLYNQVCQNFPLFVTKSLKASELQNDNATVGQTPNTKTSVVEPSVPKSQSSESVSQQPPASSVPPKLNSTAASTPLQANPMSIGTMLPNPPANEPLLPNIMTCESFLPKPTVLPHKPEPASTTLPPKPIASSVPSLASSTQSNLKPNSQSYNQANSSSFAPGSNYAQASQKSNFSTNSSSSDFNLNQVGQKSNSQFTNVPATTPSVAVSSNLVAQDSKKSNLQQSTNNRATTPAATTTIVPAKPLSANNRKLALSRIAMETRLNHSLNAIIGDLKMARVTNDFCFLRNEIKFIDLHLNQMKPRFRQDIRPIEKAKDNQRSDNKPDSFRDRPQQQQRSKEATPNEKFNRKPAPISDSPRNSNKPLLQNSGRNQASSPLFQKPLIANPSHMPPLMSNPPPPLLPNLPLISNSSLIKTSSPAVMPLKRVPVEPPSKSPNVVTQRIVQSTSVTIHTSTISGSAGSGSGSTRRVVDNKSSSSIGPNKPDSDVNPIPILVNSSRQSKTEVGDEMIAPTPKPPSVQNIKQGNNISIYIQPQVPKHTSKPPVSKPPVPAIKPVYSNQHNLTEPQMVGASNSRSQSSTVKKSRFAPAQSPPQMGSLLPPPMQMPPQPPPHIRLPHQDSQFFQPSFESTYYEKSAKPYPQPVPPPNQQPADINLFLERERQNLKEKYDYTDPRFFTVPRKYTDEPLYIKDLIEFPAKTCRPEKVAFIIRGLPGSGKSYMARLIKEGEEQYGSSSNVRVLSIDDYFTVEKERPPALFSNGNPNPSSAGGTVRVYEYDPSKELEYKLDLLKLFRDTMQRGFHSFVIVDSINCSINDVRDLYACAIENGFIPYVIEMEAIVRRLLNDCFNGEEIVAYCYKHNRHGRSLSEIRLLYEQWELLPVDYLRVDAFALRKSSEDSASASSTTGGGDSSGGGGVDLESMELDQIKAVRSIASGSADAKRWNDSNSSESQPQQPSPQYPKPQEPAGGDYGRSGPEPKRFRYSENFDYQRQPPPPSAQQHRGLPGTTGQIPTGVEPPRNEPPSRDQYQRQQPPATQQLRGPPGTGKIPTGVEPPRNEPQSRDQYQRQPPPATQQRRGLPGTGQFPTSVEPSRNEPPSRGYPQYPHQQQQHPPSRPPPPRHSQYPQPIPPPHQAPTPPAPRYSFASSYYENNKRY